MLILVAAGAIAIREPDPSRRIRRGVDPSLARNKGKQKEVCEMNQGKKDAIREKRRREREAAAALAATQELERSLVGESHELASSPHGGNEVVDMDTCPAPPAPIGVTSVPMGFAPSSSLGDLPVGLQFRASDVRLSGIFSREGFLRWLESYRRTSLGVPTLADFSFALNAESSRPLSLLEFQLLGVVQSLQVSVHLFVSLLNFVVIVFFILASSFILAVGEESERRAWLLRGLLGSCESRAP